MKNNIVYLGILACFIGVACQKEIKLKDKDIKSRLVVNSLFQAEDTLRIQLSESRNILYNNGGLLPNVLTGEAELFNTSNQSLGKFIHKGEGVYYLPGFFPQSGKEYNLKVNNKGFEEITAKNKIPAVISITNIDTLRKADYMDLDITFKDNGDEKNYYGVFLTSKDNYYDNNWACTKDINVYGSVDSEGEICSEGGLLFNDDNFNGSSYTIKVKKYMYDEFDTLIVSLRSISADLYKYRTTLQKYKEVNGNPFGEPVQVFSNVENGFGIFAGLSVYTDTIVIE